MAKVAYQQDRTFCLVLAVCSIYKSDLGRLEMDDSSHGRITSIKWQTVLMIPESVKDELKVRSH